MTRAMSAIVIPDGPRFFAAGVPRSLCTGGAGGTASYGYGAAGAPMVGAIGTAPRVAGAARGIGNAPRPGIPARWLRL
jgi:hypothetical protein